MAISVSAQVDHFFTKYRDLGRASILAYLQEIFDEESGRLRLSNDYEDFSLVANQRVYPFDSTKANVMRCWDAALVHDASDPVSLEKISVRQLEVGGRVPRVTSSDSPFQIYQEAGATGLKQLGLYPPPSTDSLIINDATNAGPIVIGTNAPHGYSSFQQVHISGVLGNTNANGTYFIWTGIDALHPSGYDAYHFALFYDADLQLAVPGSGAYVSGGTASSPFLRVWVTRSITLVDDTNHHLPDSITDREYLSTGAWLKHARSRHTGDVAELSDPKVLGSWPWWQTKMRGQVASLFPDVVPRYEPYIRRTIRPLGGGRGTVGDARRS